MDIEKQKANHNDRFFDGETVYVDFGPDGETRVRVGLTFIRQEEDGVVMIHSIHRSKGMTPDERISYGSDTQLTERAMKDMGLEARIIPDTSILKGYTFRNEDVYDADGQLKDVWK